MKLNYCLVLTILPVFMFAQNLKRNVFAYEKLKTENFSECDETLKKELETAFIALEDNNSKEAVKITKKIYQKQKDCYQIYEVYGYTLFRSGEWFDGVDIIEKGIEKFGSVPELIKRKAGMSLEMAEMGTGGKNIDGSTVYKANSLKYDEEQFKIENLKSAAVDLEYLMGVFKRSEDVFYVAKIQQMLKNYDKSNELFTTLFNDEEYKHDAIFNIADNYIAQNKLTEAEAELTKILEKSPKEGVIYEKLAEIYAQKKDKTKQEDFKSKAIYYKNIPIFSDLAYSKENLELLRFFGSDEHDADKKEKKLDDVVKQNNPNYTIDVCLMILKLHTNHGNGIEEKAAKILGKIGKPAVEKVNKLFQSDVSTCTITNLADIMATVKDESSWELMKQYLPMIAKMPMTLIPPNLPEKMIAFDEDRGIKEILTVVKPLLSNTQKSDDPMAQLSAFGQFVYYAPLKNIKTAKLKKIATELNYSKSEIKQLEEKIK